MSRPIVLREALLDPALLDALPGLATALALVHRDDDDLPAGSPSLTCSTTPTAPTSIDRHEPAKETVMSIDTSDDHRQHQRIQRAEDDAAEARAHARLEEDKRIQEALRLAGYDAPISERTRPATPRVSD